MHKSGEQWLCVEQIQDVFTGIRERMGLAVYASTHEWALS